MNAKLRFSIIIIFSRRIKLLSYSDARELLNMNLLTNSAFKSRTLLINAVIFWIVFKSGVHYSITYGYSLNSFIIGCVL